MTISERELRLVREMKAGSIAARNQLLIDNLNGILSQTRRFWGTKHEDDAKQSAVLGFLEKLESYDEARGASVATFCSYGIKDEIAENMRTTKDIPVDCNTYSIARRMERKKTAHETLHGEAPPEDYADSLANSSYSASRLRKIQKRFLAIKNVANLDDLAKTTPHEVQDPAKSPEEVTYQNQVREVVGRAVTSLTEQQKKVVVRYFGLDGEDGQSMPKIAPSLGVTYARVQQIQKEALKELKSNPQIEEIRI